MFSSAHSGMSSANHSKTDAGLMNWQETLACFGIFFGGVIILYLFCRCCRDADPVKNNDTKRPRLHVDESLLRGESTGAVPTAIHIDPPPPSAEAEASYYAPVLSNC